MPTTSADTLSLVTRTVSVAPLVLLSVVDHYNRVATGRTRNKRVVGVLLGQNDGLQVRVSNSFAVPFEEEERDPSVWFLDHNYIESMTELFKKINAKERLIGWYHSGPKLRASDLEINELFKRYTAHPLLVIVDVQPKEAGVPTDAYFAVDEIKDDGTTTSKTFVHTPSIIEAEEAEEIGVEHLLRDIRDVAVGTLSTRITNQLQSLQGLHLRLRDIAAYLEKVLAGTLPVNHAILGNLQDVFNLLPNLSAPDKPRAALGAASGAASGEVDGQAVDAVDAASAEATTTATAADGAVVTNGANGLASSAAAGSRVNGVVQSTARAVGSPATELAHAMSTKTNDQLMAIYLSSLIRAITAFHDLIDNKIQNRQQNDKDDDTKDKDKDDDKDGAKDDKTNDGDAAKGVGKDGKNSKNDVNDGKGGKGGKDGAKNGSAKNGSARDSTKDKGASNRR